LPSSLHTPQKIWPSGVRRRFCAVRSWRKTRHCRTNWRIRWSAPVIRSLLRPSSRGHRRSLPVQAWMRSGLIDQRQSIIRVELDPVLFKIETLLAAIRAVNWSHREWKAQLGDSSRDRLAAHLALHTMMSSHEGCFGTSKPIFRLKYEFFPGGKGAISCSPSSVSRLRLEILERGSQAALHRSI
jgi:hypothetical protein